MNFKNLFLIVVAILFAVFGQAEAKINKQKIKNGAKKALGVASKVAPVVAAFAAIARG
uniref:Cecropin 4 n=1 Tax=Simulium bannaense TaxID=1619335 RepID=A0A0U2QEK1_9DIPT|nr:cecropin 4 precursor [Simulium bannaense]